MALIALLLNTPYTLLGLISALATFPYSAKFSNDPLCVIFKTNKCWWGIGPYKYMRAATTGHVILLTQKTLENDLEHELIHVRQYQHYPLVYPVLYYMESVKKGYRMNKFEDEAFTLSGSYYRGNGIKPNPHH